MVAGLRRLTVEGSSALVEGGGSRGGSVARWWVPESSDNEGGSR